jgi:cell division protein FtsQ
VKRPEGFDHRPAPQPEQQGKANGRRPTAPPKAPRPTGATNPDSGSATPGQPGTAGTSSTGAKRPADPGASQDTGGPGQTKAAPATPKPARTRVRPDKAASTAASAARQDRRKLRKAARARRKFERSEVRRFTRRTRHRRAAWVTVAAIVASLAVVLAVAVYSPILALREITVDGTNRVSTAEVTAALDDQLGTPLALIDFGEIRSELAAFPLIRSYVTETVPPNTLRIHVVEREAVGTVERNGSYEQVDPAGVVVASSSERPAGPLIVVSGSGTDSAAFASAAEVLLTMPQAVLDRIDTISARTADDVRLTLRDTGATVSWGSADDSELKGQVLARMLERPECAGQVVDVTAPLAPICGPE